MSTRSTLLVFRSFPTFFRSSGCRFSRSSIVMTAFSSLKSSPAWASSSSGLPSEHKLQRQNSPFSPLALTVCTTPLAVFWNKWRKYNAFILFLFPFFCNAPQKWKAFFPFHCFLVTGYWLLVIAYSFSLSTTKGNVKFHAVIFSVVEDKPFKIS